MAGQLRTPATVLIQSHTYLHPLCHTPATTRFCVTILKSLISTERHALGANASGRGIHSDGDHDTSESSVCCPQIPSDFDFASSLARFPLPASVRLSRHGYVGIGVDGFRSWKSRGGSSIEVMKKLVILNMACKRPRSL